MTGAGWWGILRTAGTAVLLVGGLALFGLLVYLSGPAQVFAEITRIGALGFLVVVLSAVLSLATWSLSWYVLLRGAGIPIPWHRTVAPLLAGYTVTYLTPSMYLGGEPVRAYWVARDQGVPTARVMGTVVVERMLSGFSVLAFASIGAVFTLVSPGVSLADKGAVALILGSLYLLLGIALVLLARRARWLSRPLSWLARRLPRYPRLLRAAGHVAEMEDEIHRAFTRYRGPTLLAFALQLLSVFTSYLRPQIFFHFTRRSLFTFPELSLYFTLSLFVNGFLWITPGGFGVTDGGRSAILSLLGISWSGAVAFNVVYRFVDLLLVGVGAQLLLGRGLVRLRRGRVTVAVDPPPDGR
ncbi:MAG: flippase-like domain-containing protein [Candidatus Bipolaricaulota bacterium]|nr:flippase-like domain-containing protein [Candidatus Bipolaricaulota bacterium]